MLWCMTFQWTLKFIKFHATTKTDHIKTVKQPLNTQLHIYMFCNYYMGPGRLIHISQCGHECLYPVWPLHHQCPWHVISVPVDPGGHWMWTGLWWSRPGGIPAHSSCTGLSLLWIAPVRNNNSVVNNGFNNIKHVQDTYMFIQSCI